MSSLVKYRDQAVQVFLDLTEYQSLKMLSLTTFERPVSLMIRIKDPQLSELSMRASIREITQVL
jgi:hypothetical protein